MKGMLVESLPDKFSSFRHAWDLQMDAGACDAITYDKLCQLVISAENSIGKAAGGSHARDVQSESGHALRTDMSSIVCHSCGGKGHMKRECSTNGPSGSGRTFGGNNGNKKKQTFRKQGGQMAQQSPKPRDGAHSHAHLSSQLALSANKGGADFSLDSGASRHITKHQEWLTQYEKLKTPKSVRIGDDNVVKVVGIGSIACEIHDG